MPHSNFNRCVRGESLSKPLRVMTFVLASVLAIGVSFIWAQGGRGSIIGTVTDQTEALIPSAKVSVTHIETSQVKEAETAQDGAYVVSLLPPGTYTVSVSKDGFNSVTRSGIVVTPDQAATVNIAMAVGNVRTTVEVAANAEMITTSNASIAQLINETTVTELPLNGRSAVSLAYLAPGATNGQLTSGFVAQFGMSMAGEATASINGSRQTAVFYLLNGASNMSPWQLFGAPVPNSDATAEFQVITNNFSSRYGFSSGGVVSIVTKSGSNTWHGNAFEFLRNSAFNAKSYFGRVVDPLKRNQFGGSVGGKIIKDKLFVFGNYQATIGRSSTFGTSAFVPSNAMLNGDFSAYLAKGIQLFDQNGSPYPNNFIDPSTFNPISLKVAANLPKTSDPLGLVGLQGIVANDEYQEFTVKTDFYPSPNNHFSITTFLQKYHLPQAKGGGNFLLQNGRVDQLYQTYSVNWVHNLGPNLLNNLIFGYSREATIYDNCLVGPDGKPVSLSGYGMKINEPTTFCPKITFYIISGAPPIGSTTSFNPRYSIPVSDGLTWTKGKHMITAGVDILRENQVEEDDFPGRPPIVFTGLYTGQALSDFLTGRATIFLQGAGEFGEVYATNWGFYAGDTIRLKPNLSLDVGLRWQPVFPPTVVDGRMTMFRPGQQSTRFPNAPLGEVFPGDKGIGPGGFPNQVGLFDPRLGIAWQPKALPNTSIRAAFGMFMQRFDYAGYAHGWDGAPFAPAYFLFGGPGRGQFIDETDPWASFAPTGGTDPFPDPFPWAPSVPPNNVAFIPPLQLSNSWSPNFKMGRVQSWNLSIEHQFTPNTLFRIAYVGSEAYHLQAPSELNPGIFSAGGARALANYQSITENQAMSTASYNGLQLTFEKRMSHGLQFTSNYTYSKNLDSNSQGSTAWSGALGNPFDLSWNRGISSLNVPYIWSNQGVYKLPKLGQFNKFVNGVLGSWELSGIWQLQAGRPVSIVGGFGNNNSLAGISGDRADVTGQPLQVHQGPKSQWLSAYFNTAAFRPNAPGTFGNSLRNVIRAPRYNNVDLAIIKNIPFREHYSLQFRWEMFNAFNYVQFAPPVNDPSSASFGRIVGQANANRVMQVALKLYW